MESKCDFYEIVNLTLDSGARLEGAILGKAQSDSGEWFYAVHVYSEGISRCASEIAVESTGRFDKRENFYDGTTVRVNVDPKSGEGFIVDASDGAE